MIKHSLNVSVVKMMALALLHNVISDLQVPPLRIEAVFLPLLAALVDTTELVPIVDGKGN